MAENPEMHVTQEEGLDVGLTKEKYDKLVAAGFIFEKPIEGDVQMEEVPQEDVHDVSAPTVYPKEEEDEEPTLEDNEDAIEIFIGYEDPQSVASEMDNTHADVQHQVPMTTPESVSTMPTLEQQVAATEPAPVSGETAKEMEFNDPDVHAILGDKDEHQHMEHGQTVPMPAINDQGEHMLDMQSVEPTDVHNVKVDQEQEPHVHAEQPIEQQPMAPELAPSIPSYRRQTLRVKVDWEERVLELIQFKLRKHHCNVPAKWKPNPDLADWVWRQRAQYRRYRQNQSSTLTTSRILKLADLGFEFVALDHHGLPIDEVDSKLYTSTDLNKLQASKKNPKRKGTPKSRFKEGKWLESLAKVVKYKEEVGNCNVPRKWKRDPTLGEWVHFQRRQFRLRQLNRRNHMTDERIRKLEAIGFEWSRGTANQPSYIRLYEQNKELAAQSGLTMQANEHQVTEAAAMNEASAAISTSEVPADVSQIAIMDGEEQVKAAEIAAVVEEQLKHPVDTEPQQVVDHHHQQIVDHVQHQQVIDHQAHQLQHQQIIDHHHQQYDAQHYEQPPQHHHHEVINHQHHDIHHHDHHHPQQVEEQQRHMEAALQEDSREAQV